MVFNTRDGSIPSIDSPYHYETPPDTIKIGFMFSSIDETTGIVDVNQAQALAAFLMAVEDVNVAFGSIFKFRSAITSAVGFASAVKSSEYLISKAFSGTGVDVVVNAAGDVETEAALKMFEAEKLVQVHALAQATELGSGDNFPYKVQVVPIDSFQGMAYQSIMCQVYQYKKTSVFATSNEMGSKSAMESGDGTYCDITKITTHLVKFNTGIDGKLNEWDDEIKIALNGGARIFLLFLPPKTTAGLLVRGHQLGLFKQDTQIFLNAINLTPDLTNEIYSLTQSAAMVKKFMKGVICIKFAPVFHWRYPAEFLGATQPTTPPFFSKPKGGRKFVDAFRKRTNTIGEKKDASTDVITCNSERDDASRSFLWREQGHRNLSDPQIICAGVDFSKFTNQNGADIWPYTGYVYDAVWMFAYGLNKLFSSSTTSCTYGKRCIDGDEVSFIYSHLLPSTTT
jgi:hypothetical protein